MSLHSNAARGLGGRSGRQHAAHPAALGRAAGRRRRRDLGQVRVREPGRLGQGPRRPPDHAATRWPTGACARADPHRLHQRQHRRRLLDDRRRARHPGHPGHAGQRLGRRASNITARLRHRAGLLVGDGGLRRRHPAGARDGRAEPERYFYPDQYSNASNPRAHYLGTGAEILALAWATGSPTSWPASAPPARSWAPAGGSRSTPAAIQVVAVEPDDALHGLEGLKHLASSLVPADLASRRASSTARCRCRPTRPGTPPSGSCREEGVFVGHSAGANVAGACEIAREAGPGAVVVTVLPDRGDRYFAPMKWERQYVW